MSMYVCIHIYMYVCVIYGMATCMIGEYVCMYVRMYVCMYVYVYVCMFFVHMSACMCVCMYTQSPKLTHTFLAIYSMRDIRL